MANPYEQEYDDSSCAWCGATLPENPGPESWAFEGYCDAVCALYQGFAGLGIAAGMSPPINVGIGKRDEILRALADITRATWRQSTR